MGNEMTRKRAARWRALLVLTLLSGAALRADVNRDASAAQETRLRSLRLDGFYDPERGLLQATARLTFVAPAANRRLWLAEDMQLTSVQDEGGAVSGVVYENGELLATGGGDSLEICYSGQLRPLPDPFADSGAPLRPGQVVDPWSVLSYVRDYYPHPGLDFAEARIDMRLPEGWNCLGSGVLRVQEGPGGDTVFRLENPRAKGMALVCGRFRQIGDVPAPMPVKLYGWPGLDLKRACRAGEIGAILRFYLDRFGPLAVSELNVLLRRGQKPGGLSYSGLVVLSLVDQGAAGKAGNSGRLESPLALSADGRDILAHELAHQWWGGMVSWRTAGDSWITEGLATYCSLAYLEGKSGARERARLIARLKRWVARFDGQAAKGEAWAGPADPEARQALFYAKPALMLCELAGAIGEQELFRRLRGVLQERQGGNLSGGEFLDLLAAGDTAMRAWMQEWIYGHSMPQYYTKKN